MDSHIRHTLFPLLAALIWGTAFSAQSIAAAHMEAMSFNCARSLIAAVFLAVLDLVFSRATPGRRSIHQLDRAQRGALLRSGLLCGTALCLASNLQQLGIADTGAGKAGFLTAIYIVFIPLLGLLFQGKRATPLLWGSVAIAVVGLYFLCVTERFTLAPADLLLLLCSLLFAVHTLIIERFSDRVDGIQMSCVQFLVAGLLSGAGAVLFEHPTAQGLAACLLPTLYVGVFSSGVGYTLQILSLRGADPTVVSLLLSMESVFAVLGGAVLLGERMNGRELLGCALMLAAVVLAQLPAASGAKTDQRAGKS